MNIIFGQMLICPNCNYPTYKDKFAQVPTNVKVKQVNNLPEAISQLYREALACMGVEAYTSAVLAFRKMLMNIAVHEGATENLKFYQYIDFLEGNGYMPPKSRAWVDKIRKKGNEATHEINFMSVDDANEILMLTELLLTFIYEVPRDE